MSTLPKPSKKAAEATEDIWRMEPVSINKEYFSKLSPEVLKLLVANYGNKIYMSLVKYNYLFCQGYLWISNHDLNGKPEATRFESLKIAFDLIAFTYNEEEIIELAANFKPMFITIEEAARKLALDFKDPDKTSVRQMLEMYESFRNQSENKIAGEIKLSKKQRPRL